LRDALSFTGRCGRGVKKRPACQHRVAELVVNAKSANLARTPCPRYNSREAIGRELKREGLLHKAVIGVHFQPGRNRRKGIQNSILTPAVWAARDKAGDVSGKTLIFHSWRDKIGKGKSCEISGKKDQNRRSAMGKVTTPTSQKLCRGHRSSAGGGPERCNGIEVLHKKGGVVRHHFTLLRGDRLFLRPRPQFR